MKTSLSNLLCASLLLAATACNTQPAETSATAATATPPADSTSMMSTADNMAAAPMISDDEFMKKVAEGGHNEMSLSKIMLDKNAMTPVKNYANEMITDHTKAGNELKPIAAKYNVTLPTDADAEHKALQSQMEGMSGPDLEQKYAQQMVTDHQKTVDMFQSEIQNGQDADVKDFAQKTLPTIQTHLANAKKLPGAPAM